MSIKPTVVLVHGAFSDGASWSPVAMRLLGAGFEVRVPAISNRSLTADAAYVRSFVERIDGPVLLVGHSYGATVAGVAGDAANVSGIVFIEGYVLEVGESALDVHRRFPDPEAMPYFDEAAYPVPGEADAAEVSVRIEEFPFLTALGVPADEAAVLAVTQRPLDADVLSEPATVAAWHERPSWGVVATADRLINPDAVRFGLERAGAREVVDLPGPHLVLHTHPGDVTRLIVGAADAVR
jgi:pimeloyl-ACP methyl ester carboxylesterase